MIQKGIIGQLQDCFLLPSKKISIFNRIREHAKVALHFFIHPVYKILYYILV